jgi:hypothetical protein
MLGLSVGSWTRGARIILPKASCGRSQTPWPNVSCVLNQTVTHVLNLHHVSFHSLRYNTTSVSRNYTKIDYTAKREAVNKLPDITK